jgi:hypothetical protein
MSRKQQPFDDTTIEGVEAQAGANEERQHLKLVNTYVNGSEDEAQEDARRAGLAKVFSSQTSAASHVIAQVLEEPTPRAFLDALIGVTGGRDEYVEVTDEQLAAELGCSTKTIQTYRKQLRAFPNYTLLVDIKEHWRDTETGESHPHAYHVHVTRHAIEAEQNARMSAEWNGDAQSQVRALSKAAEMVVRGASPKPPRKAKTRRKPSDAELMMSKLKQAANALRAATALRPMVKNPDFDQLLELRDELQRELDEFNAAFGLVETASMQDQERRRAEAPAPPSLVVIPPDRRVETAADAPWVEKFSTQNDLTDSTTYGNAPPDEADSKTYLDEVQRVYQRKVEEGLPEDEAADVARSEVGDYPSWKAERVRAWDSAFGRLKGGGPSVNV